MDNRELQEFHSSADSLTDQLWQMKENVKDLNPMEALAIYEKWSATENLTLDLVNCTFFNLDNVPHQYVEFAISTFRKANGLNYNRLIIDTLLHLKTPETLEYIHDILKNDQNSSRFINDFKFHPYFETVRLP